jgi:hypothetical protein
LLTVTEGAFAKSAAVELPGVLVLKPLSINKCKSGTGLVRGKKETDIQCYDVGAFKRRSSAGGGSFGASYSWIWYRRVGDPVVEKGVIAINLGNGAVYLRSSGLIQPIGKVTPNRGKAHATGTWVADGGTKTYKHAKGSGTYSLSLERDANTYRILKISLSGTIR